MIPRFTRMFWATLEFVWYPLLALLTTPYFLKSLGPVKYGCWMLLSATIGLGSVLSTGTGAAIIKEVSAGIGRAGPQHVGDMVRVSLAISLAGGGVLAAVVLSLFWLAGGALFVKIEDPFLVQVTGAFAALLIWIEQIDNVFSSALRGAEHFGRSARIEIVAKSFQIIAAVIAVLVWGTLPAVYVAVSLVAVLRLASKALIAKKILALPSLRPTFANLRILLQHTVWGWLQGVGGLFFSVVDRLMVGSMFGAVGLAHYSLATQLAQHIHALPAAGLSVLFPEISRREDAKDFSLWKTIKPAMAVNAVGSTLVALAFLLFSDPIFRLWLGRPEEECSMLLRYLAVAYLMLAFNVVPHYILLGLGKMRYVAIVNLAAGLVLIVTMIGLAHYRGLAGVAIARIVYGVAIFANLFPLIGYFRSKRGVGPC
jgi:O-antigen/teichoic acid export membrane protein